MPTLEHMSHHASPNGLNGSTGTATADDRRRSEPRVLCDREISLMPLGGGGGKERFVTAHLTDVSPHGLGLVLSEPAEAGQQLLVRMNLNKLVLLVYTLRYCIPTRETQFRAGASFTGFAANAFQGEPNAIVTALTGDN